ncbi:MAG: serine/threonine-protein kinase [Candidatus Sulfotelmatobacter sp.]|jgi:non-specific serine/threonine protein kinase/serine/threonine-protein kinase
MSNDDRPLQDLDPKILPSQSAISHATTRLLTDTTEHCSIGHYRLLKKLGEGGMGQVWLAEQMAPVRRQVALKLIRAGMCDDTMLHRFQSEGQSLAIMDHPSIAKVFDAGATADGQPYLVMEYVPGLPITDYCDQKKLSIRERLKLFIPVCEGVQHAHQKSIIHRDLKPANVLVVEVDGKPTPRIIDFGLAKPAFQNGFAKVTVTMAGAALGTPAYMSPEQADPRVRDVDTRTDVYSLGVLLYELLTGTLPFDPEEWEDKPLDYVLRQVRESDTPRPSTQFRKRASTDREAASAAADVRSSDCKQLSKTLRGDLDWIAMKALEKDRARRYGTPFELSTDVSSYLDNEPVLAGPSTRGYRIRKYAVRHRIALSVAAGLLILLSGFVVAQAVALRRITQERDRATRITNFMTGIFKVSKPSEARGNTITAREILDKASVDINTGLTKDPELQAQMMFVMGDVYDNLGLYSRAQALQQKTVEIRRRTLGPENPETLKSMSALAVTLRKQGHFTEAETLQRQTLDAQRRVLGAEDPDTLRSMYNLGRILWGKGRYPEAEKLDRETLDIQRRVLGPEHPDTLTSISNLAADLRNEHRHPEAQKLFRETFDIRLRVLGPEHPDTLTSMSDLANILTDDGQYDEAAKLHREVLDTRRRVLGPEHPETLTSMNNLADTLVRMREYPEAEQLVKQAFDIQRRVLGPDSPDTALTTYNLACIASYRSEIDEAFSLLTYAVDHGLPPFADLFIVKDNDLKSLRGDPRFAPLVTHAEERAAAAQKGN